MSFSSQDERFMRRALALARRGVGQTSPNPAVGAAVVRGGRIIGEGFHRRAGGPHAEIVALRDAGVLSPESVVRSPDSGLRTQDSRLWAATLYVTLEPCCTHGRTPPCTDAIIAAGIKRVVVAAVDPNPRHRGRGVRLLRRAGIRVETGLLADEATNLNVAFNKWITTGKPLVIAKAALTLDGRLATRTGDSKWITSEAARREAHRRRAQVDAVVVGANTVMRDDPQLTLRHGVRGRQPWRVVVDGRGRCPRTSRLFTDAFRPRTIVITSAQSSAAWRRYLALLGITVLILRARGGRVELDEMLAELGRMEITSVLVEGGSELLGAFFDSGLVDRVAFFYAPKVVAGCALMKEARRAAGAWRRIGAGEILFEGVLT